jgi:hypothetical protein
MGESDKAADNVTMSDAEMNDPLALIPGGVRGIEANRKPRRDTFSRIQGGLDRVGERLMRIDHRFGSFKQFCLSTKATGVAKRTRHTNDGARRHGPLKLGVYIAQRKAMP